MSLATSEPQNSKFLDSLRARLGIAAPIPGPPGPGLVVPGRGARLGRAGGGRLPAGIALEHARGRSRCGLAAVTLAVLWVRVISPLRWWTKPTNRRRDRGPFPPARPAHPNRRPVCRALRRADRLRRRDAEPGGRPGGRDRDPGAAAAARSGRALAAHLGRRGAGGGAALTPALDRRGHESRMANRSWSARCSSRRPYTTLSVAPGNLTVEQGESVPIAVE